MPSTFTTRLKAERPATGEQAGTWGETVNLNITDLIDESVYSVAFIAMPNTNLTLTIPNAATSPNRAFAFYFTGTLTAARTVTLPDVQRRFEVTNNTLQILNFKISTSPLVPVIPGETAVLYASGATLIKVMQTDPVVSDVAPTSPKDNDLWFDGSRGVLFIWFNDGNTRQWVQTVPSTYGLTIGDANTLYVAIAGGTMTGPLVLSGPPTLDLHAASKKYVDDALVSVGAGAYTKLEADTKFVDAAGDVMSGVLALPDGTAALPALSFSADPNTGLWRSATDTLAFTTGGTNRVTLSTTAIGSNIPFRGGAGSITAPVFSFTADTNTGLYWIAADSLGVTTNGVNRLSIDTAAITSTLPIALPADPASALHAATKQYVDATDTAGAALKVNLAGDTMTGALTLPVGSAAAPALMMGDTNSGLIGGADSVAIVAGGVARLTQANGSLTSTTPLRLLNGTVAAPAYSFTGDTDTGMYLAGADQLGFTAGGVQRFMIDATALTSAVPILLPANPTTALQAATKQYVDSAVTSGSIVDSTARTAAAAAQATADAALPKVGGTMTGFITLHADPTSPLHAATRQYVLAQTGSSLTDAASDSVTYGRRNQAWVKAVAAAGDTMSGALVISANSTTELLRVTQTGTGDAIRVEDSTNPDPTPFVVDATGKVGIGVPVPTVSLDIVGNIVQTGGSPYIRINKTTGASGISYIQWSVADVLRHQFYMSGAEDTPTGGATGSDFAMQRYDNSGANGRLSWHILRLGGEWGINGIAQAGVGLTIRSDPTAPPISDRGINLLNLNTGTDASTDITFSTASNALRARIRGGKEGAANAGRLVFSTTVIATESDVLTLASDKSATFASHINTAGYVNIKRSIGPYIMLDTPDATPRQRAINSYTNGLLRWSMHMGSSDAEDTVGGGTGSDFVLYRYTDAGAAPTIGSSAVFNADRETGNVAFGNNGAVPGVRLYIAIQANEVVQDARALRMLNGNAASDASVSVELCTASGALRGQIRAKREAATSHGSMILSSALAGVAQDVLTLDSARTATFGGAIVGGTIQAQSLLGGSTATEIAINAAFSTSVAPPAWPITNGGMISVRGNTNGNYAAGAVSVYSGSGSTGVALLPGATAWSVASDEREKHILGDVADGLAAILGIKPIRFRYLFEDSEAPARIGFGARNVQEQIPEAVTPVPKLGPDGKVTGEERLALAPTELIPHLVRAIQQLFARIEQLEKFS